MAPALPSMRSFDRRGPPSERDLDRCVFRKSRVARLAASKPELAALYPAADNRLAAALTPRLVPPGPGWSSLLAAPGEWWNWNGQGCQTNPAGTLCRRVIVPTATGPS